MTVRKGCMIRILGVAFDSDAEEDGFALVESCVSSTQGYDRGADLLKLVSADDWQPSDMTEPWPAPTPASLRKKKANGGAAYV